MKSEVKSPQSENKLSPWGRLWKELGYHILIWPALIYTLIFNYIPMGGIVIAFQKFNIRKGIFDSPFVWFDNFRDIFVDFQMPQIILNTLIMGFLGIVVTYPVVIGFALLINELHSTIFKRVVQTISYLPHFVSWTVMAIIIKAFFNSTDGLVSELLLSWGLIDTPLNILTSKEAYVWVAGLSTLWKEMGWTAILFLATIAGIDPSMYEAARIDGANRFQCIWYITLPSLKAITAISLIMSLGSILGVGFDQAYYLSNPMNLERARTLSYYVYTRGMLDAQWSFSTAMSLVLSVIGFTITMITNKVSRKLAGKGLY